MEPVPNVFEEILDKQASEEKTSDALLDQPPVQHIFATSLPAPDALNDQEPEVIQDTRAPVGKDAGAAEHTGAEAAAQRGGWEGGVEDQGGMPMQHDRDQGKTSFPDVAVPHMDLDEEAERLVDQALAQASDLDARS